MSYGIKSPARYMQGNGELANLGRNVKKMGEKFLVLCSPNNKKRVGAQIEESLKSVEKEVVFCEFNGECTKAEITRVMDAVTENNCDVVSASAAARSSTPQRLLSPIWAAISWLSSRPLHPTTPRAAALQLSITTKALSSRL